MIQSEESKNIQDHLGVFHHLAITILQRRALFRNFENNLKGKGSEDLIKGNSFVSFYITDYAREQLIDLRKFFEADSGSYKVSELLTYIGDSGLSAEYEKLDKKWKSDFRVQVNKLIAHIDKGSEDLVREVSKQNIDAFIDSINTFFDKVVNGLRTKGQVEIESSFRDSAGDFLNKDQEAEFKEYLGWTR